MADGTVKVPGVGPVKKSWAIAGVAVLGGILAVAYYRHAKNAAAAPATDTTGTQPDPNAIDPATGLTYGEEAAGIQAGDLAGAGTPYGDTSGIVGYDAQGNPVYADTVGYGPSVSFVNNSQWAQAAEQYLTNDTGADAGTVAAALGAYLAGKPLSQAQATVVQSAIAFFGQPPNPGPNGYPPALNMSHPPGHPPPPPPPKPKPQPNSILAAPGHFSVTPLAHGIDAGWGAVKDAKIYELSVDGPTHLSRTTTGTHGHLEGLKPGRYRANVRAGLSSHDIHGHWSVEKVFTVKG